MKKVFAIVILSVLVWSCSKKMTPAGSETPASNSTSNNNSFNNTTAASTTTATSTAATTAATTTNAARTSTAVVGNEAAMAGQSTYNAKCGRCHGLKVVGDYTKDRWISVMQVMAPKANLSETEKANVLAYVTANAKNG